MPPWRADALEASAAPEVRVNKAQHLKAWQQDNAHGVGSCAHQPADGTMRDSVGYVDDETSAEHRRDGSEKTATECGASAHQTSSHRLASMPV